MTSEREKQERERQEVKDLFTALRKQPMLPFPQARKKLEAPLKPGMYVIRKNKTILHVGRTHRGRNGIHQRLANHLHGSSSFTKNYLHGNGATLRKKGYTYQYLELEDSRKRAFLEHYAIGTLCPRHLGTGE